MKRKKRLIIITSLTVFHLALIVIAGFNITKASVKNAAHAITENERLETVFYD